MKFEEVLPALKAGSKVTLEYAGETGFYYYLKTGEPLSPAKPHSNSFIMMANKAGSFKRAKNIENDILRDDWVVLS